jgi:hypothetical protein
MAVRVPSRQATTAPPTTRRREPFRSDTVTRIVDPRSQQSLAVGSPPVAAEPEHGLGRDMLRQAVGNVVVLWGGQQTACPVGQLGHVQRAVRDISHALPRRVDPRVRRRARGRHRFRDAGRLARVVADAQHPQPPVQREHDRPAVRAGRVGHDPGQGLVCPLPPDAFGLGPIARSEFHRAAGSARSRSRLPAPSARSSPHKQVTGSSPLRVRRNSSRPPSREIVTAPGTPSVKRLVLASCRRKSSITTPALATRPDSHATG